MCQALSKEKGLLSGDEPWEASAVSVCVCVFVCERDREGRGEREREKEGEKGREGGRKGEGDSGRERGRGGEREGGRACTCISVRVALCYYNIVSVKGTGLAFLRHIDDVTYGNHTGRNSSQDHPHQALHTNQIKTVRRGPTFPHKNSYLKFPNCLTL